MQEPEIKAVDMVRSIREAHYSKIKELSPEEKIAFFRKRAHELHAELGRAEELSDSLAGMRGVRVRR